MKNIKYAELENNLFGKRNDPRRQTQVTKYSININLN